METFNILEFIPGLGFSAVFVWAWFVSEQRNARALTEERNRYDTLIQKMIGQFVEHAESDNQEIERLRKERDNAFRRLGLRTNTTGDDPAATQPKPPAGGL